MAARRDRERASLMDLDHVALAFLPGVTTLLVSGLLWFGVWFAAAQFSLGWQPSFGWVVGVSALMVVHGFGFVGHFVGPCVGRLLRWILNLSRAVTP